MGRVEKTVFMSYRRANAPWVLAIYQDLTHHGYDVFYDYKGIASGNFESVILENIRARAHFLILLTPSALQRCNESGDWLHREIETALDSQRNIIPLMLEGFDFSTPAIVDQLRGKLAALKSYNGLNVPVDYFSEAMKRLRESYLNVAIEAVLHPASSFALQAAREQQAAARSTPTVDDRELDRELAAQQWYEQAVTADLKGDRSAALQNFDDAIRFKPDFADAYKMRSILVRSRKKQAQQEAEAKQRVQEERKRQGVEVFVSYSRLDNVPAGDRHGFVDSLVKHLRARFQEEGVPDAIFWQDRSEIEPGDVWSDAIGNALNRAELFIAIVSKNYINSSWCKKEVYTMKSRVEMLGAPARRIFRVDRHMVPEGHVPDTLRGIQSVRFYREDKDAQCVDEFFWGGKVRFSREYDRAVRELSMAIQTRLDDLRMAT
jgi:hypothetical protein